MLFRNFAKKKKLTVLSIKDSKTPKVMPDEILDINRSNTPPTRAPTPITRYAITPKSFMEGSTKNKLKREKKKIQKNVPKYGVM